MTTFCLTRSLGGQRPTATPAAQAHDREKHMATVFVRRSVAVATLATLATMGSSLVGSAVAAPFTATGITTQPAPDSNKVVAANRPTVKASFSDNLASNSKIRLTEKGKTSNLCSSFQVSGKDVSCTPTADLSPSKTYDAVGRGVSTSGDKAKTPKLEFTVNYPQLQGDQSTPIPNGSVVLGDETLTAQFDQEIGPAKDTPGFRVFEYDATAG